MRRLSPSSDRAPSSTKSLSSANTTSSLVAVSASVYDRETYLPLENPAVRELVELCAFRRNTERFQYGARDPGRFGDAVHQHIRHIENSAAVQWALDADGRVESSHL